MLEDHWPAVYTCFSRAHRGVVYYHALIFTVLFDLLCTKARNSSLSDRALPSLPNTYINYTQVCHLSNTEDKQQHVQFMCFPALLLSRLHAFLVARSLEYIYSLPHQFSILLPSFSPIFHFYSFLPTMILCCTKQLAYIIVGHSKIYK